MPNYRGASPILARYHGATPIAKVYRGNALIWSANTVSDPFEGDGFLDWINELCTDATGLFAGPFGEIVDGLDNGIGQIVAYVQGGAQQLGTLLSNANVDLADAYCGMWGGTAPPEGLTGLINGVPIFGPIVSGGLTSLIAFLESILGTSADPTAAVTSIIGQVPVIGSLGSLIGLSTDGTGALTAPLNFVTDAAGEVLGTISCGAYKPNGGALEGVCFVIGVVGNAARMIIPDGLLSLDPQTSRLRNPATLLADDGYIETQIAEIGSPDFVTQVFRRYANDGSGARGVGMDFRNSQASIVRRVGGVETLIAPNLATFSSGDVMRLVQAGNLHTLVRNGLPVGAWPDNTNTAASGVNNRSIALLMQGAKQLQGTRQYSPSLNYVEAA